MFQRKEEVSTTRGRFKVGRKLKGRHEAARAGGTRKVESLEGGGGGGDCGVR